MIEAYATQPSSLFEHLDALRQWVGAYWAGGKGIRLWSGLDSGRNP